MQPAMVSDAHAAPGLLSRVAGCCNHGLYLARSDLQQRRSGLGGVLFQQLQLEQVAIGQYQQADQAGAALRDVIGVEAQQGLPVTDLRAVFYQQLKTFALQVKGVQTHMQQHLGAIIGT